MAKLGQIDFKLQHYYYTNIISLLIYRSYECLNYCLGCETYDGTCRTNTVLVNKLSILANRIVSALQFDLKIYILKLYVQPTCILFKNLKTFYFWISTKSINNSSKHSKEFGFTFSCRSASFLLNILALQYLHHIWNEWMLMPLKKYSLCMFSFLFVSFIFIFTCMLFSIIFCCYALYIHTY